MTRLKPMLLFAAVLAFAVASGVASAACIQIKTAADLNKIRQNLFGDYCLVADIDLAPVANFTPIGLGINFDPFIGTLDGRGHAIRNLKVRSNWVAGLFGGIGGLGGTKLHVKNLRLINVRVTSTRGDETGGLAGVLYDGTVAEISVSGSVTAERDASSLGGLFGEQHGGLIIRSHSSATVSGRSFGQRIGGLVGEQRDGGITQSYATGPVTGAGASNYIGGLVGFAKGDIRQSFASGPVSGSNTNDGMLGGLVGDYNPGQMVQAFATGPVTNKVAGANLFNRMGGITGVARGFGTINQTYAVGRLRADRPRLVEIGGILTDHNFPYVKVTNSYWSPETTGVRQSDAGTPLTARQLQSALPRGFGSTVWGITPGVSFPYLKLGGLDFWAPLAITLHNGRIYTFLPISQREKSEYGRPVRHSDQAGQAAVFAMVARAIGITRNVGTLKNVRIDAYWNDTTRNAHFSGTVTTYAALGQFQAIPGATPISERNIVGQLRARRLAVIRGTVNGRSYWMLATSFVTNARGTVTRLIANDPWAGRQVQIDAATKKVVYPAGFPLPAFRVNGYRLIVLK